MPPASAASAGAAARPSPAAGHLGSRIGDAVWDIARRYAGVMNASEFATTLRAGKLPRDRYVGFITAMYPCVVGFNRALLRGIAKVDNVRRSGFVRALAEQLLEEQEHNDLWRLMLDRFGIDHPGVYDALQDYLAGFTREELDEMTLDTIDALAANLDDVAPGAWPDAPFPEPVLALYHYLWMTATDDAADHWEQFASQSAMEWIIYDVVSTSVFPGIAADPHLHAEPDAARWWTEHAKQGSDGGRRTDEEKHLELARIALNRAIGIAPPLAQRILARVENASLLFTAALTCHDERHPRFDTQRFRRL